MFSEKHGSILQKWLQQLLDIFLKEMQPGLQCIYILMLVSISWLLSWKVFMIQVMRGKYFLVIFLVLIRRMMRVSLLGVVELINCFIRLSRPVHSRWTTTTWGGLQQRIKDCSGHIGDKTQEFDKLRVEMRGTESSYVCIRREDTVNKETHSIQEKFR